MGLEIGALIHPRPLALTRTACAKWEANNDDQGAGNLFKFKHDKMTTATKLLAIWPVGRLKIMRSGIF